MGQTSSWRTRATMTEMLSSEPREKASPASLRAAASAEGACFRAPRTQLHACAGARWDTRAAGAGACACACA
eukprot:3258017-Prymnesium_polylepis.2